MLHMVSLCYTRYLDAIQSKFILHGVSLGLFMLHRVYLCYMGSLYINRVSLCYTGLFILHGISLYYMGSPYITRGLFILHGVYLYYMGSLYITQGLFTCYTRLSMLHGVSLCYTGSLYVTRVSLCYTGSLCVTRGLFMLHGTSGWLTENSIYLEVASYFSSGKTINPLEYLPPIHKTKVLIPSFANKHMAIRHFVVVVGVVVFCSSQ